MNSSSVRNSSRLPAAGLLADQVRWRSAEMVNGGIDQSQLAIADAPKGALPFSFLVMGDTDAGLAGGLVAQQFADGFAQQVMQQVQDSRFLLHTGDVTYPTGSYENYFRGFLQPYRALLKQLPGDPGGIKEKVVFKRALLPVPGNHDYAQLPPTARRWQGLLRFVCDRLRTVGVDWGHYGGEGGEAYAQAFLDDLKRLTPAQMAAHLATHYDACGGFSEGASEGAGSQAASRLSAMRCLNYRPGTFTRLPNRYYRFGYGGVDFFALDSNTWAMNSAEKGFDAEQLDWLVRSLVASWRSPKTVGRIIYLHHSPYTTEQSRWQQPETLWVRRHLRVALDSAMAEIRQCSPAVAVINRPIVDLVLSGHAHCLEHVKTMQTHHADANMDWVVCGGSGVDLRRQRSAGGDILEQLSQGGRSYTDVVAKSQRYVGAQGLGAQGLNGRGRKQSPAYSFLRVAVDPAKRQPFCVMPFAVSRQEKGWQTSALEPLTVGRQAARI